MTSQSTILRFSGESLVMFKELKQERLFEPLCSIWATCDTNLEKLIIQVLVKQANIDLFVEYLRNCNNLYPSVYVIEFNHSYEARGETSITSDGFIIDLEIIYCILERLHLYCFILANTTQKESQMLSIYILKKFTWGKPFAIRVQVCICFNLIIDNTHDFILYHCLVSLTYVV